MFATMNNPAKTYAKVGLETGVDAASPVRLIVMLYDGALLAIASAEHHMKEGRVPEKGQAISHAIRIISEGLRASLDFQVGSDLAEKLDALYDYMEHRLMQANLQNQPAILREVAGLLRELKSAWEEIASDSAAVAKNKGAA
ncbi:MAG: flagellar export chaperone FliS [Rhodocyclaceae bacterium]|nr:flagellar export chaperone FliS [Rhodocyclaceae bacterium]